MKRILIFLLFTLSAVGQTTFNNVAVKTNLTVSGADAVTKVANVAALKAIVAKQDGMRIDTLGYYSAGDGGGASYYFSASSSATDDGGSVIQPNSGSGRFLIVKRSSVSVLQFGAKGDGSTDDAAAINSATLYGARNYVSVFVDGGKSFRITSPILLHDNSSVVGNPLGLIVPDFTGSTNDYNYAAIRNTNLFNGIGSEPRQSVAALATNISLANISIKPSSSATTAKGVVLVGVHNAVLENVEVIRTYGNWAFTFYCNGLSASKLKVTENSDLYEDGIHILGGEAIRVTDSDISSGDDSVAIGWDGSDVYAKDIAIVGNRLKSNKAYAFKIFSPTAVSSGSTFQQKIVFDGNVCESGISRNGGVFLFEQGTPRGSISNVVISSSRFTVNTGTHDGTNPYGFWMIGGTDVSVVGCSFSGNSSYSVILDATSGPIRFIGCDFKNPTATSESVYAQYCYDKGIDFLSCNISNSVYRTFRLIESDASVVSSYISGNTPCIFAIQTATNATRSIRVLNNWISGAGVQTLLPTGSSSNLLCYQVIGNQIQAGALSDTFTATRYSRFGNRGNSESDLFTSIGANTAVITNAYFNGAFEVANTAPTIKATADNGTSGLRVNVLGASTGNLVRFQTNGTTVVAFGPDGAVTANGAISAASAAITGAITAGAAADSTSRLTLTGGASGGAVQSWRRTVGAIVSYDLNLGGNGWQLLDNTASRTVLGVYGNNSLNEVYAGAKLQNSSSTTPSVFSATSFSSSAGSNVAGVRLDIQGGAGTGTGTPGVISFKTAATTASGTTAQSTVEVGRFDSTTASATLTPLWINYNGTLKQVEVGAADSGGTGFRLLRITN